MTQVDRAVAATWCAGGEGVGVGGGGQTTAPRCSPAGGVSLAAGLVLSVRESLWTACCYT